MRKPLRLATIVPLALAATLAGCGGSTSPSGSSSTPPATGAPATAIPTAVPTAPPTDTPTAALSNATCPSADTVNAAMGVTVGSPMSVPADDLPAGSSGFVCTYTDTNAAHVVIIDIATGPIASQFISKVESGEQTAAEAEGDTYATSSASGVGSQAAIGTVSSAGSPIENGILAVSGNTGIVITAKPAASESQLESFASQLLG